MQFIPMTEGELTSAQNDQRHLFQEIVSEKVEPIDLLPDKVEAYISKIEPKKCGKLIKELGYLLPLIKFDDKQCAIHEASEENKIQWPALGHLRRVRRIKKTSSGNFQEEEVEAVDNTNSDEPPRKRKKATRNNNTTDVELEILLGSVIEIDNILDESNRSDADLRTKLLTLISYFNLTLEKKMVPGRPAKSQTELTDWMNIDHANGWWPTLYFKKQSTEYRQKELELSLHEQWGPMRTHLMEAIDDAKTYQGEESTISSFKGCGAVIVCPESDRIVSRSFDEWSAKLQEGCGNEDLKDLLIGNPLNTPAMLAIQGVSRIERQHAIGKGMDSVSFKSGQYLCTGYDVYTTKEPAIFEAMALVHSRVRRVIFCIEDKEDGGLGGTGIETSVHCLPGTNHRFRAFKSIVVGDDETFRLLAV
eukprot:scaffold10220_cov272-Chaetoceros_neogracile.AAC.6